MSTYRFRAASIAALSLLLAGASAADYSVAPSGNDAAAGSAAAPWLTLQHAAATVRPGDTVDVRPGNYAGFIMGWDGPQSGTASAPIIFRAEAGATIVGQNNKTRNGIDLESTGYIVIDGFTIVPAAGEADWVAGIRGSGGSTGLVFRNNVIHVRDVDQCGIITSFTTDLLVEGNTISGGWDTSIYVANSPVRPVVRGNTMSHCLGNGILINADFSQGGTGIAPDAVIERNVITNVSIGGAGAKLGAGSAINLGGVQRAIVRDNLLYAVHAKGITLAQIDAAVSSTGNLVVGNTVVVAAGGQTALRIADASTGNTVFDNILISPNYAGTLTLSSASVSGLVMDRNAVSGQFSDDDGDSVMTLADWRSAHGQDAHSFVGDPAQLFVSPSAADYRLANGSLAIDAGVASLNGKSAPTVDLVGALRPQGAGYDLGAYEKPASAANQAPSVAIASPATGASFLAPATIAISATAADSDGTIAKVDFYQGATLIGSDTSAPYSVSWSNVVAGSYTLTAKATDNAGASTTSAGVTVTVSASQGSASSIWSSATVPPVPSVTDAGAVELGVKFRSDVAGTVSGVRFYKGSGNGGTHTGHLWSSAGALLATVAFSGETASGWQQASFASPVAIQAGTTYIVSYYAPLGHYASSDGFFATSGVDAPPLHALKAGVDGANGVYRYGANGSFPNQSYQSSNYWVDVVFGATGTGLLGRYWSGQTGTFTGSPTLTRADAKVDFDWGTGAPGAGVSADHFSARWTGYVKPPASGIWSFSTISDDGVRVWVNGQLLVDDWTDHTATVDGGAIALTGGTLYPIVVEYYENLNAASMHLLWSGPATPVSGNSAVAATTPGDTPVPQDALYAADIERAAAPTGGDGGGGRCGLGAGVAIFALALALMPRRRERRPDQG